MADGQQEKLAEGTLLSHLVELRSRLFKMLGAVFVVFLVLLPFAREIFNFVAAPLCAQRSAVFDVLGCELVVGVMG